MTTFGKRLLYIREKLGLRQEDVEARTGIPRTYISQLENDKVANPGLDKIITICRGLNMSPDEFLGWKSEGQLDFPDLSALNFQERQFIYELVDYFIKKKEGGKQ